MNLTVNVQQLGTVVGERTENINLIEHDAQHRTCCNVDHDKQMLLRDGDREDIGLSPFVVGVRRRVVFEVFSGDHGMVSGLIWPRRFAAGGCWRDIALSARLWHKQGSTTNTSALHVSHL